MPRERFQAYSLSKDVPGSLWIYIYISLEKQLVNIIQAKSHNVTHVFCRTETIQCVIEVSFVSNMFRIYNCSVSIGLDLYLLVLFKLF